jgi:hypothetical protein
MNINNINNNLIKENNNLIKENNNDVSIFFGNQEEINVLCIIHKSDINKIQGWSRICVLRNVFSGNNNYDTYHNIYLPEIISIHRVTFSEKDNGNPISYYGMNYEDQYKFFRAYALEKVNLDDIVSSNNFYDYYILRFNTNYFRGIITLDY